jgi:hypothetical protein
VEVMAQAVEAQGLAAEAQVAEAQVQAVVCRDPAQALGQVRVRAQARAQDLVPEATEDLAVIPLSVVI